MANLGFVGLGVMGSEMVSRLLQQRPHGHGIQPHARQGGALDPPRNEVGRIAARGVCCC